jgi:hypothetical protein
MSKRYEPATADDGLFPSPLDFSTWSGCVRIYNAAADFNGQAVDQLEEVILRSDAGVLLRNDWITWERKLDTLIQRFIRSSEIREQAFDAACRVRFGIEVGTTVMELRNSMRGKEPMLVRVKRGGMLPRRGIDKKVGLCFEVIEELDGQFLACPVGFFFLEASPKSFASAIRVLPEIHPIDPDAPGMLGLPAEVFDDALMDGLHQRIEGDGAAIDRASALLAFWDHKRLKRRDDAAPYKFGDIVRIHPKSGKPFHVAAHSVEPSGVIQCYDPRNLRSKDGLGMHRIARVSVPLSRCEIRLAQSVYNPGGAAVPTHACHMLAMRETARLRYTG